MTVTADAEKRIVVPSAQPGDRFDLELSEGKVVLTPLAESKPAIRYVKRDGLLLASTERPITWAETRKAMDEYP